MASQQTWTTLGDAPPGAIIETQRGELAVVTQYRHPVANTRRCILLGSGENAHWPNGDDEPVLIRVSPTPVTRGLTFEEAAEVDADARQRLDAWRVDDQVAAEPLTCSRHALVLDKVKGAIWAEYPAGDQSKDPIKTHFFDRAYFYCRACGTRFFRDGDSRNEPSAPQYGRGLVPL